MNWSELKLAAKAELKELGANLAAGAFEATAEARQRLMAAARDPELVKGFARGLVDGWDDKPKKRKKGKHGDETR